MKTASCPLSQAFSVYLPNCRQFPVQSSSGSSDTNTYTRPHLYNYLDSIRLTANRLRKLSGHVKTLNFLQLTICQTPPPASTKPSTFCDRGASSFSGEEYTQKNALSKSKSWPNPTSFISTFRVLSLRIGKTVKTIEIVPIKIKHVKQPPFNQNFILISY